MSGCSIQDRNQGNTLVNETAKLSQMNSNILYVVRICAAWMVLLGHSFSFYQISFLKDQSYFPYIQNIGVVIFFELSGFLTAYSLSIKNVKYNYKFKEYAIQRATRIGKAYVPALLFVVVLDFMSICINKGNYRYLEEFTLKNFIGNIFMLQNIPIVGKYIITFGSARPLWTLSIEWWLYMTFGFVFLTLANKKKITSRELIFISIISITPLSNLLGGRGEGLTICFLFGVFAFYIYKRLNIRYSFLLVWLALTLLVISGIYKREAYCILIFVTVFGVLVALLNWGKDKNGHKSKVLHFLAGYTFMLYLVHYSIIDFLYSCNLLVGSTCKMLFGIILSNIMSIIMYFIFEYSSLSEKMLRVRKNGFNKKN